MTQLEQAAARYATANENKWNNHEAQRLAFIAGKEYWLKQQMPHPDKPFIVANVRDLIASYDNEELSISALTETLNRMAKEYWEGQGWVRVEDRLPDYGIDVLVYGLPKESPQMGGSKPIIRINRRIDLNGTSAERDKKRLVDENDFPHMVRVTHWRYLPAKPNQ